MATAEDYGVESYLISSEAQAGVSGATRVYFFGSCPKGELNKPYDISGAIDAEELLGCVVGNGYSLSEALGAMQMCGLGRAIFIPVSHDISYSSAWIGQRTNETGVYAYEKCLREDPGTVNILCAPGVTDSEFLSALQSLCHAGDGEIKSYMIYDVPGNLSQVQNGYAMPDAISEAKVSYGGCATAVWGCVRTNGGYSISGSAVRACMQALSDREQGAPSRVGGNLPQLSMVGIDGRNFGSSARYPLFLNIDSTVGAGSAEALNHIFPNAILSSNPLSYSLSKILPMFAKDIHGAKFPAHLVMQSGEIREVVVTMDNTSTTWSFNPSGVENNESIEALIGYEAIEDDMLLNPVVIPVSATYQGKAIDFTESLNTVVDYVSSSDGVIDDIAIIPGSVKVGGVGFVYDETANNGKGAIVNDLIPILNGTGGKPVVKGSAVYGIYKADIAAFYAFADDERHMDIREGAYADLITLKKLDANKLSADGICSWLNKYGTFYSWGDHTSAFKNNKVADERWRFENQERMTQYLANWTILTFGNIIDDGMTLQMRNNILMAIQTKLNSLVGIGALIGTPSCTFEALDNPKEEIAQGHFVFNIRVTGTIPAKYLVFKVRYTDDGLKVYTSEAE